MMAKLGMFQGAHFLISKTAILAGVFMLMTFGLAIRPRLFHQKSITMTGAGCGSHAYHDTLPERAMWRACIRISIQVKVDLMCHLMQESLVPIRLAPCDKKFAVQTNHANQPLRTRGTALTRDCAEAAAALGGARTGILSLAGLAAGGFGSAAGFGRSTGGAATGWASDTATAADD